MDKTVAALCAELDEQIVATIDGREFTRAQLSAQFDRVKNAEHWKLPIDAVVTLSLPLDMHVMSAAIAFFTGSAAEFFPTKTPHEYRVRAVGYYAAIGA